MSRRLRLWARSCAARCAAACLSRTGVSLTRGVSLRGARTLYPARSKMRQMLREWHRS